MANDLPTLLDRVSALVGRKTLWQQEASGWANGSPTGGPNNDGRYPFTAPDGTATLVPSPQKIVANVGQHVVGPEWFGAIGDGESHPARGIFPTLVACQAVYPFAKSLAQEMDFLAWQKMVNTPGHYRCPDHASYRMCNPDVESMEMLNYVAGVCSVHGGYGRMLWHDLRPKVYDAHYLPNYGFASADGWTNAPFYQPNEIVFATFDQGYARMRDPYDGTLNNGAIGPYYEWWKDFTIEPGRYQAKLKGRAKRGVSYDHGNFNPAYAEFYIPGTGKTGKASITLATENADTTWVDFSAEFDFVVTGEPLQSKLVFHGGGYADFDVTLMDIVDWPDHYAMIHTRDGSPAHYFLPLRLSCITIEGPGRDVQGLWACIWHSFADLDGSHHCWEEVEVKGWYGPAEWGDGAYLLEYHNCSFVDNGSGGIYFKPNRTNAGENMKFFGGSISNSDVKIRNPGAAEITLLCTVVDYSNQLCAENAGQIRLFGTRHEQKRAPGKRVWHCIGGGRVIYTGCFILMAGAPFTADLPPALLEGSNSTLEFHATEVYGASSTDESGGLLAEGPGYVVFNGFQNSGQPNFGRNLITEAPNQDVLGGAGTFEPNTTVPSFVSRAPSDIFLTGGAYGRADREVIDKWNTADLRVSVSDEHARTGTRSMRIEKVGPNDNRIACELHIAVPLNGAGNLLGEHYMLFPNAMPSDFEPIVDINPKTGQPLIDPATGQPFPAHGPVIYYRQFWRQCIGYDRFGRPVFSEANVFKGEVDFKVPLDGSTTWERRGFNTAYSPSSTIVADQAGDRSPAWATHLVIQFDMQSIPPMTFYLDDLRANFIG